MSMYITRRRAYPRSYGLQRYQIGFSSGIPVEFVIQSPPRPQTREWQALFTKALADAMVVWRKLNYPRTCAKHPKYKAIRKPRAKCPTCESIWNGEEA